MIGWKGGTPLEAVSITLSRILGSFTLAVVGGVRLGLLMGRVRVVRLMARPIVSFLFPTPKVAVHPAPVILFGLGTASKVAMGFAEAVFPILPATTAAASHVEPRMVWPADGLGHTMAIGYRTPDTADMYVAVVAISAIGLVFDRLFLNVRARLLFWSMEGQR